MKLADIINCNYMEITDLFTKNNAECLIQNVGGVLYFMHANEAPKCFVTYLKIRHPDILGRWYIKTSKYEDFIVSTDEAIALFSEKDQKLILFNLDLFL